MHAYFVLYICIYFQIDVLVCAKLHCVAQSDGSMMAICIAYSAATCQNCNRHLDQSMLFRFFSGTRDQVFIPLHFFEYIYMRWFDQNRADDATADA